MFGWLLPIQTRGRLPFPLSRLSAHKSFAATASGIMNDATGVRKGSLPVTFTPR